MVSHLSLPCSGHPCLTAGESTDASPEVPGFCGDFVPSLWWPQQRVLLGRRAPSHRYVQFPQTLQHPEVPHTSRAVWEEGAGGKAARHHLRVADLHLPGLSPRNCCCLSSHGLYVCVEISVEHRLPKALKIKLIRCLYLQTDNSTCCF